MSRIILIEPAADFNAYGFVRMPLLGPVLLATILRDAGHDPLIIADSARPIYDPTTRRITDDRVLQAEVVGISAMTPTANRAYAIADAIKRANPRIRVVIGGVHPTFMPEEAIQHADAVVRGEADHVIADVMRPDGPSGIIEGGGIHELNSLPIPDLALLDAKTNHLKFAPISSSRGCPYDCSFCSVTPMFGRRYRFRSVELVIEEMQRRISEGFKRFFFHDDNLTANTERTKVLCEELIRRKLPATFVAQARVEVANDPEMLQLLSRAGCTMLFIGFESINPKTLVLYRKHQTFEQIAQCVARLRAHGIAVTGMFVIGADEDEISTIDETLKFCRQSKMDYAQFAILVPLPGTRLKEQLENEGRIFDRNWSRYDGTHVVFTPRHFSPLQLQKSAIKLWHGFYAWWTGPKFLVSRYLMHRWQRINRGYLKWLADFSRKVQKTIAPLPHPAP